MTHGPFKRRFWGGVFVGLVGAGALAILALISGSWIVALAGGVAAIAGVTLYEDAFVRAGQSVPLS
jgi:hypothetical protein